MERYRHIIPQFDEFLDILKRPQPHDIRVNMLKSSVEDVKNMLDKENIGHTPRKHHPLFLTLDTAPGKSYPHWRGDYYVQELVSGIPPLALNPQPGETVLDMCAAPGSKTTQMSAMMDNHGTIHANDVRKRRSRSLMANIYRTGAINVKTTESDGRGLPENHTYDKILVDAPCTGEGNAREKTGLRAGADPDALSSLPDLQKQLLDKAFRLCRKGGTIVYSTCTFAPEENELIVQQFLEKGTLEPMGFDFQHSPGITKWQGDKLNKQLANCTRIYPHQLNSGGMFVAKFTK